MKFTAKKKKYLFSIQNKNFKFQSTRPRSFFTIYQGKEDQFNENQNIMEKALKEKHTLFFLCNIFFEESNKKRMNEASENKLIIDFFGGCFCLLTDTIFCF